jgi:hypothetical protein
VPVFGFATTTAGTLSLHAGLAVEEGRRILRRQVEGSVSEANALGRMAAEQILNEVNN